MSRIGHRNNTCLCAGLILAAWDLAHLPASLCHDEYGHSFGCPTKPCLTGLIQQYRTLAANSSSHRM